MVFSLATTFSSAPGCVFPDSPVTGNCSADNKWVWHFYTRPVLLCQAQSCISTADVCLRTGLSYVILSIIRCIYSHAPQCHGENSRLFVAWQQACNDDWNAVEPVTHSSAETWPMLSAGFTSPLLMPEDITFTLVGFKRARGNVSSASLHNRIIITDSL